MRGDVRGSAYRKRSGWRPLAAIALAVPLALALGACSIPLSELPGVGLPANTPPRPETPAAYPDVHDVPAERQQAVLDGNEQARVEKELTAARDRQTSQRSKAAASDNQ